MKDTFPASEEPLAAQALCDEISASHVFLFPLTSAESLQICADTNRGGTRPAQGMSNSVLEMQSVLSAYMSPHAPTVPAEARSAPTSPMAQVHPWAAGVESHILTTGSVATALQPSFWRLCHCTGSKCSSGELCGEGHLIACRWGFFPQRLGKKRENIVGPGHHFLSEQALRSMPF